MVNACLLMVLMVTAVPTSSAIRRITKIPRFRGGLRNHGFGDFPSPFPNAFSIAQPIPGVRRPKAFSIGEQIPGMRRPGRHRGNRIRGFDVQTESSFQHNSYILPPESFQSNFNSEKSPSSSLMFMTGLPKGFKSSSDIFDEEESISIGKLEAFLLHGDSGKPNQGNFEIHFPQTRPHMQQKQRPRQPRKKPMISESLKIQDHGPSTNLIFPFPNSFHDIHKNNFDLKPKRKPNDFRPTPNPLISNLPQPLRAQEARGERIRQIPMAPPVSRPNELHIIIHNSPPIKQALQKDTAAHLPPKQHSYGAQRKPPLQLQFDEGQSRLPLQTQVSIPQNHNQQSLQAAPNNNNGVFPGGHAASRQISNSDIIRQVSNIPTSQGTHQISSLFIQPSFASSLTPQVPLLPPSPALNPSLQVNTKQNNYAVTQPHPQIAHNPSTIYQGQNSSPVPVQQQTTPVAQLPQPGVHGNQLAQHNYISPSQNDQRGLQQNVQVQQSFGPVPQNLQQNYISTLQGGQRVLQNSQHSYVPTLQNDQRILPQNLQPSYISTSQNNPSVLQQNVQQRPLSLVSSVQSTHVPLSQNVQPGYSTTVQYKQAVNVQQVNPSHQISNLQYKQAQQTYLPTTQNFGYSSSSQPSSSSSQLSQDVTPQNVHSASQQNGPVSTVPNFHQSYISTSSTGQDGYGSPGGAGSTHLVDQQNYGTASQNVGIRTVTHSIEQQRYTGSHHPTTSEKHPSQTVTLVQSTSNQKLHSSQDQNGQFYSTTNQQEVASYVPSTKPITFTVNPSSQTTAKYIIVKPSTNSNNGENNVVYSYKPQPSETHATSSSSSGYVTPGRTYNKESSSVYVATGTAYSKDSSSGYVMPGTTYSKDLSDERDSDTSYTRQPSSASSKTFIKNSGSSEGEEFDEDESSDNASYKVMYIPLNILKSFLTKGASVNNE